MTVTDQIDLLLWLSKISGMKQGGSAKECTRLSDVFNKYNSFFPQDSLMCLINTIKSYCKVFPDS